MVSPYVPKAADRLAARILDAHTGHDLHQVVIDAGEADLTAADRQRLQLLFGSRMRELWPRAARRGRS